MLRIKMEGSPIRRLSPVIVALMISLTSRADLRGPRLDVISKPFESNRCGTTH
ncbi:MAG: Uncharacterised protein [Gammaproteobacteria bacterium]|nr:MAG: Uncharacterised protein [Gammaproteobacteria bacterium]